MWLGVFYRKPEQESYILEINFVIVEVENAIKHLKEWMKPEVPEKPLLNFFDRIKVYSDPLGVVLVMGAWNYPVNLTLSPLLGKSTKFRIVRFLEYNKYVGS